MTVLEKCPYRIQQCRQALAAFNMEVEKEIQAEVRQDFPSSSIPLFSAGLVWGR